MTAGSDSVRPPLQLPKTAAELALRLSRRELTLVERGMAVHAAARKPQLTWAGWHDIAVACAIGADHIKQLTDGRTKTPSYITRMHAFLAATGFIHLSKDDRACAVRLLPYWDEIDAWRSSLPKSRQQALNNPREVVRAYRARRGAP
jgi:hypothetical protein